VSHHTALKEIEKVAIIQGVMDSYRRIKQAHAAASTKSRGVHATVATTHQSVGANQGETAAQRAAHRCLLLILYVCLCR
jgi:hypothetical protein